MLRKKFISVISAVTIMFSMIGTLSAYAANTPKVTAEITGYTGVADSTFNLVVSYSGFDDLYCDLANWVEWGIDGYQIEIDLPGTYKTDYTGTGRNGAFSSTFSDGFSGSVNYNETVNKLRIASTFTWDKVNGGGLLYNDSGSVTIPIKLLVPYTETVSVDITAAGFSTAEYDADGNGTFPKYDLADKTVVVEGDEIVVTPSSPITVKNEVVSEYTGDKTLIWVAQVLTSANPTKKVVLTKKIGDADAVEQVSDRSLAQILGGEAVSQTTLSAEVAIGVLTADTNAVFGFELR